jgi:hypothetical protein
MLDGVAEEEAALLKMKLETVRPQGVDVAVLPKGYDPADFAPHALAALVESTLRLSNGNLQTTSMDLK